MATLVEHLAPIADPKCTWCGSPATMMCDCCPTKFGCAAHGRGYCPSGKWKPIRDPARAAPGVPLCRAATEVIDASRPSFDRFICTREKGHEGDHVAHDNQGLVVQRWTARTCGAVDRPDWGPTLLFVCTLPHGHAHEHRGDDGSEKEYRWLARGEPICRKIVPMTGTTETRCVLREGHRGYCYAPGSEAPAPRRIERCGAKCGGFECTKPMGHEGWHVAHGAENRELQRWPKCPCPRWTPTLIEALPDGGTRTTCEGCGMRSIHEAEPDRPRTSEPLDAQDAARRLAQHVAEMTRPLAETSCHDSLMKAYEQATRGPRPVARRRIQVRKLKWAAALVVAAFVVWKLGYGPQAVVAARYALSAAATGWGFASESVDAGARLVSDAGPNGWAVLASLFLAGFVARGKLARARRWVRGEPE